MSQALATCTPHPRWFPTEPGYYWAVRVLPTWVGVLHPYVRDLVKSGFIRPGLPYHRPEEAEIVYVFRGRRGWNLVSVGGRHHEVSAFRFLEGPISQSQSEE